MRSWKIEKNKILKSKWDKYNIKSMYYMYCVYFCCMIRHKYSCNSIHPLYWWYEPNFISYGIIQYISFTLQFQSSFPFFFYFFILHNILIRLFKRINNKIKRIDDVTKEKETLYFEKITETVWRIIKHFPLVLFNFLFYFWIKINILL